VCFWSRKVSDDKDIRAVDVSRFLANPGLRPGGCASAEHMSRTSLRQALRSDVRPHIAAAISELMDEGLVVLKPRPTMAGPTSAPRELPGKAGEPHSAGSVTVPVAAG
jgi:hypothetical protein